MKRILKLLSFLIISTLLMSLNFQKVEKNYSLTVIVKNLRNSDGVVQFALYNEKGSIPDEKYKNYFKIAIANIENNTATITFNNLPKGIYAVNVLHDENEDGKIDKGFILPTEGIGFSNYKSIGLTNKPKFSKASFVLNAAITISIKIIYK
ncbi:MAG: DUF2141 domain-containing protein [Bacteroidetes bacterium]|nr:DUF2141 domain-containing protein [Bacteroidota bacterium]